MDDIVWIRDDAQIDDDSVPVSDQLPSNDVRPTTADEEPETFVEIPVTFQPKSTEVRFYPKPGEDSSPNNGERYGPVPVEIYNPFSSSSPNSAPTSGEAAAANSTNQKNGGGNAIVISLLFRGGNGGPQNGVTAAPKEEPIPKDSMEPQNEPHKSLETSQPDKPTDGPAQAINDLDYRQKTEPAEQGAAQPITEQKTLDSSQPSVAEPAVINLVYKETEQKQEEPTKSPPKMEEPKAEPAVISIVYKDPSEKRVEAQKDETKTEVSNEQPSAVSVPEDATKDGLPSAVADATKDGLPSAGADARKDGLPSAGALKLEPTVEAVPIPVEVFTPSRSPSAERVVENATTAAAAADEPVLIDHTTPEILEQAAENRVRFKEEEKKPTVEATRSETESRDEQQQRPKEIVAGTTEAKNIAQTSGEPARELNENAALSVNGTSGKPAIIFEDVHKTIEDMDQLPPPPELPIGRLAKYVESVIIGEGIVKYVTGSVVLPNGTVLVTDEEEGIILFDTQGNVVKKIKQPGWRKPRSPIYYKEHVLMLLDIEEGEHNWCRYIFKFTIDLQYVAKIEGPKWMRDETVISERLSIAHTDYIYLCVCGEIFSSLYELTPVGQWTELQYRLSESYTDMLAFAVVGPITQILVVEGNKHYVLMFSVRDSEVVDRRRIAVCERPGALARDEAGRLFVANRAAAAIQLVDTVRWSAARNVALADAVVPHFSASWGLLAIPLKGAIRLHRYSFRFGVNR
uniref:Titin n=1 Tax=Haemonchus contortus TaxID=6289 RepID=A0A7I4YND3_HAECO